MPPICQHTNNSYQLTARAQPPFVDGSEHEAQTDPNNHDNTRDEVAQVRWRPHAPRGGSGAAFSPTPRQVQRRLGRAGDGHFLSNYQAGQSHRAIAKHLGVHHHIIAAHLRRHGIRPTSQPSQDDRHRRNVTTICSRRPPHCRHRSLDGSISDRGFLRRYVTYGWAVMMRSVLCVARSVSFIGAVLLRCGLCVGASRS